MRQQWIKLVKSDAAAPAPPKRVHALVTAVNSIEVGTTKEGEHRKVGLAVAAVLRGR